MLEGENVRRQYWLRVIATAVWLMVRPHLDPKRSKDFKPADVARMFPGFEDGEGEE